MNNLYACSSQTYYFQDKKTFHFSQITFGINRSWTRDISEFEYLGSSFCAHSVTFQSTFSHYSVTFQPPFSDFNMTFQFLFRHDSVTFSRTIQWLFSHNSVTFPWPFSYLSVTIQLHCRDLSVIIQRLFRDHTVTFQFPLCYFLWDHSVPFKWPYNGLFQDHSVTSCDFPSSTSDFKMKFTDFLLTYLSTFTILIFKSAN